MMTFPCFLLVALFLLGSGAAFSQRLAIESHGGGFSFVLTSSEADQPWLLQHATGTEDWKGLVFFTPAPTGEAAASISVLASELERGAARRGFFRAIPLTPEQAAARRPFIDKRRQWRRTRPARYQFQIRENAGWISWQAVVTVNEGKIEEAVFSEIWPPVIEPTAVTIEDLFDRIETAIENEAERVDLTWDPKLGFPAVCFIDQSLMIADEERGWTIDWLVVPGGPDGKTRRR